MRGRPQNFADATIADLGQGAREEDDRHPDLCQLQGIEVLFDGFRLRRNADNTARFFYDVPDNGRECRSDSTSNPARSADFGVQKQGELCIDKSSLNALQERRRVLKGRKIGADTGRSERRTR